MVDCDWKNSLKRQTYFTKSLELPGRRKKSSTRSFKSRHFSACFFLKRLKKILGLSLLSLSFLWPSVLKMWQFKLPLRKVFSGILPVLPSKQNFLYISDSQWVFCNKNKIKGRNCKLEGKRLQYWQNGNTDLKFWQKILIFSEFPRSCREVSGPTGIYHIQTHPYFREYPVSIFLWLGR